MFPGPHAHVYRNEAGEPIGWDYPSDPDDPYAGPLEEFYDRDVDDPDDYLVESDEPVDDE